ncbi:MAG TPA: hypothetical protein VGA84_17290 [Thermoanaerobaculia bacterium]
MEPDLRAVRLILLFLLQWTDCSGLLSHAFPPTSLPVTLPSLRDAIEAGDGDLIVLSDNIEHAGERKITRVRGAAEELLATIPAGRYTPGEALFRTGQDQWWFSAASGDASKSNVAFVTGGADGVKRIDVDLHRLPLLWLPLRGETPAGVMLSLGSDRSTFMIDEVSPSGIHVLGTYPGHLPGNAPSPRQWSAERMPDGRIAMLSIEESVGSPSRLMLRVFDGHGGLTESPLPGDAQFRDALATAIDRNGRVVAVALSPAKQVVTTLIDVNDVNDARCNVLSAAGERAAFASRGSPAIDVTGNERIAAWIRDNGTVRACQITKGSTAVDVGENADTTASLAHLIGDGGEETVTFLWNSDRGIVTRRLPRALQGWALLDDIRRFYADLWRRPWRGDIRYRSAD